MNKGYYVFTLIKGGVITSRNVFVHQHAMEAIYLPESKLMTSPENSKNEHTEKPSQAKEV